MSNSLITQHIIHEITNKLYPEIREHLKDIHSVKEQHAEDPLFENIIEILDELRNEFSSLSNYELKLLFPSLLKAPVKGNISEELCCHISELQSLLQKKEDHIRDLVLRLEVEAENLNLEKEDAVINLIILFRHNFTVVKQELHKVMMHLQRDKFMDVPGRGHSQAV